MAASAKAMARFGDMITPNMEMHDRYREVAAVQQKLYPQLEGHVRGAAPDRGALPINQARITEGRTKRGTSMQRITVLGAGAMGAGLTRPLVDAGLDVHLWGTWLDDHLIDAIVGRPAPPTHQCGDLKQGHHLSLRSAGRSHRRLRRQVLSVSSEGVPGVAKLALPLLGDAEAIWMTSKGFCPDPDGNIQLLRTRSVALPENSASRSPRSWRSPGRSRPTSARTPSPRPRCTDAATSR